MTVCWLDSKIFPADKENFLWYPFSWNRDVNCPEECYARLVHVFIKKEFLGLLGLTKPSQLKLKGMLIS